MNRTFENQVVLITGAGKGIGRRLAEEFSRRGARIAAIDLDGASVERLMDDLRKAGATEPAGAWAVGDVTQRPSLKAAVAEVTGKLGPVDVLVANAGIGIENPCVGFSGEAFEKQIAVNLVGVANSVEMVVGSMVERRRGHIVTLSSLASYRGLPLMAGYCASKAGASALMDSLRFELKPAGIHCTTICPGWIRTDLLKTIDFPMPDVMTVDYAVERMMKAIERRKTYLAFPAFNHFMLSLSQVLPVSWGDWLMGKMLRQMAAKAGRPLPAAIADAAK